MSNDLNKAFNVQLNSELYSAYLYFSMAAYCKNNNLLGFANWLEQHAREELQHAMKFYTFILTRNWQLELLPIKAPEQDWQSLAAIFTTAYQHEQQVTKMINNLATLANTASDHATNIFLQWFVTEQLEEEATINEILTKLTLAADSPAALLFLDNELTKKLQLANNSSTE